MRAGKIKRNENSLKRGSGRNKEQQGRYIQTATKQHERSKRHPSSQTGAGLTENGRPRSSRGAPKHRHTVQMFRLSQIDQMDTTDMTEGLKKSLKID